MAQVQLVRRPRRWDEPFGRAPLHASIVDHLLLLPAFRDIEPTEFPEDLALCDILANDGRIQKYAAGQTVYRRDSYGTSLFIVLAGSVRVLLTARGEKAAADGAGHGQTSWFGPAMWASAPGAKKKTKTGAARISNARRLVAKFPTMALGRGQVFGELEALTRMPRGSTVFADSDETLLLELRWAGVRELRHWSDIFRARIDALYRRRSLLTGLRNSALLADIEDEKLDLIAKYCRFETYGEFGWAHRYQRDVSGDGGAERIVDEEPLILEEGDYLDDLLLLRAGFARVSETFAQGERTVGHLQAGDTFGLSEFTASPPSGEQRRARQSLRAVGYADIIRIPAGIVEKYLLPSLPKGKVRARENASASGPDAADPPQSLVDFTIDRRFVNGTQAMVIDTDRCVNCDDCVRACAATHDNIPRFIRHGPAHQTLMVANACMHCADPVCLIDCPTGAIRRDAESGSVVINEPTCIGCGTCASACPYNNIRMLELRNANGAFLIDEEGAHILRATKCDLCTGQRGGPACKRACPHDAIARIDFRDTDSVSGWLKRS